ncbi:MAG: penicillin-binding transpeptidase domain-containing protein [Dysosmobacter welbionis]
MQRISSSRVPPQAATACTPALDAGAVSPATTDSYPVRLLNEIHGPELAQHHTGWTSVRNGVKASINTIAVQTLERLGSRRPTSRHRKSGAESGTGDMNVSPLGLGGLTYGLSTVEMAAAYAAFANSGVYNEPKTYVKVLANDNSTVVLEKETEQRVAMKETTAYLMTDMLRRAVNESGTGGGARFGGMHVAGKIGTTNDNDVIYRLHAVLLRGGLGGLQEQRADQLLREPGGLPVAAGDGEVHADLPDDLQPSQ